MTISQPHFVCATPPSERWYQRLEERVHPPHAPVLAYTAATPRAAPHLATRRIHITAIFWAGGMLPRSAIVAAWCALLDSAALLYATLERLHAILPGRCANVAARVHAVLAAVDSAIRIFAHDLAHLSAIEASRALPTSWLAYDGPDPVLERAPTYGPGMCDGLFRAVAQLSTKPVHPRVTAAVDMARALADFLAPGEWPPPSFTSSTSTGTASLSPLSQSLLSPCSLSPSSSSILPPSSSSISRCSLYLSPHPLSRLRSRSRPRSWQPSPSPTPPTSTRSRGEDTAETFRRVWAAAAARGVVGGRGNSGPSGRHGFVHSSKDRHGFGHSPEDGQT
ncbi:hypothetical protein CspeluHIS016_0407850 [Cutaneotrichosporon spelunceum]|uniref:Uncharacterized protein n=1 Tax=Cutaneotrichosporon spelunceum TaxID=1672016 RepID=A0AAD3YCD4_9TREE|nr:hypothetical protein CspeluHIS016_0407850 [Cutaneotrichosporon spelunceum]